MSDKVPNLRSINITDTAKANDRQAKSLSPKTTEDKLKENGDKMTAQAPSISPKGRFHNAALKILSQVVQKKALGEDAVDGDDASSPKGQATKTTPRKPRPSLANIATLYSLKRMSKLPGHRYKGRGKGLPQTIEEEKFDLPERPRFCATLSMEAQYAMMKGYEDMLVDNLHTSFPETRTELQRSKTPKNAVLKPLNDDESKQDTNAGSTSGAVASASTADSLGSRTLSSGDNSLAPSWGKPQPQKRNMSYPGADGKNKPEVPKETQLRLTCRFEKAMDILDTMKESKGHIVTSPRRKSNDIQPVNHYTSWSNNWAKEFKFET